MASVFIEKLEYGNQFRPEKVDWLMGGIGQRVDVEIEFRFENFVAPTTDLPVTFEPSDLLDPTGFIRDDNNASRFAEFYVGDTINVNSGNRIGNYTITEKISSNLIRVTGLLAGESTYTANFIKNTTPINGLRFFSNMIENDAATSYESLTTGQTQVFQTQFADHTNTSPVNLFAENGFNWNFSQDATGLVTGATLTGLNHGTFQKFRINLTTYIVPLFVAGQQDDFENSTAPSYFLDNATLKHIFKLELKPSGLDPNRNYTFELDDRDGNTGWFDERFNGSTNFYDHTPITYTRVSDATSISKLELVEGGTETYDISFSITNTNINPFSAGNSQVALSFWWLPEDADEYIQPTNPDYLDKNFVFDQAFQTEGAAAVNGFQFGTDRQVLTNVVVTFVSASQIDVTATINLNAGVINKITPASAKNYLIAATVQNHAFATSASDLVTLLIDSQEFTYQFLTTDVVTGSTVYLDHKNNDLSESNLLTSYFPEDNLVAKSSFVIDRSNGATIQTVASKIVATKSGSQQFTLDQFQYDMSNAKEIGGAQFVDYSSENALRIPAGEIRRDVILKRDQVNDVPLSGQYSYTVAWPFTIRWEDWVAKAGVDGEFLDQTQPQNGLNENWYRYASTSGWSVKHVLEVVIEEDGLISQQTIERALTINDYESNTNWINEAVIALDPVTLVQIPGNQIYLDSPTLIRVSAESIGVPPGISEVAMIVRVRLEETDDKNGITRFANKYETDGNTYMKSSDEINFPLILKVTEASNVYTAECLIDHTKLPTPGTGQLFVISARVM